MASEPVARTESFTVFIPELERLIAEVMEEWKVGASRCCAQLPSDFATSDLEARASWTDAVRRCRQQQHHIRVRA
jgi:hypothetical protein